MDTHGNKNYFKFAFILHDIVTKHLRNIFRQEWDTQHPSSPWKDDKNSLQYLKKEAQKLGTWKELNAPKSGDIDEWDPTNLFYVLLYSKTINLSAAQQQHIHKLRQMRNKYFAHPSKASIGNTAFKAIYQDIKVCMISLHCSNYVQKQMEDVKNEIMKVPEDYMKEVEAKLYNNNRLLLQLPNLLRKYGNSILFFLVVIVAMMFYLLMSFLHPNSNHIDLPIRKTCSNSRSFFPESQKPSYYIGHDDEVNKGASFLANGSYSMVRITGLPAIGKTATAVAIGQVLKNSHGYQVAFVDFKQINVSSSHIRTDIYKYIVLSIDYELETVPDSVQEFKILMIKITTCPTLLIFDNIENILQNLSSKSIFYEVTKECLAVNKIKIVATSQKEFDIIGVPIYRIILEPLQISQSTSLLLKLLPGFLQENSVKKIAEKTGGIPLLLELTASLIRSKYYEEAELLKRFEELPILIVLNDTKDMTESSNYYKLLKILFDGFDPGLQFIFIAFGAVPISFNQTTDNAVVNFYFNEKVNLYPLVNTNLLKTFDLPNAQRLYGMHPVIGEFTRLVINDPTCTYWSNIQVASSFTSYVKKSPEFNFLTHIIVDTGNMTLKQPVWEYNVPTILVHNGLAENRERYAKLAFQTALATYDLGQYTKCIDILPQAIELLKGDNNQLKCLADFALNATAKFLKIGKLNLSLEFRNLLLKMLNLIEMDDPCFVATILLELGTLSNNMMYHEYAVFVLKQALKNYQQQYQQQNCSKENLGSLAFYFGVNFYNRRQYHACIQALHVSDDLLKSHDDQLEANWLLATSYYKTEDYESCFQMVQIALNSSYEVDYHKQKHIFQALTDLALNAVDTYLNRSNVAMAIQFSILSLNTLKMLETDSCFISSLYLKVGVVFYKLRTFYRHATFAFNQTWTFLEKNECGEDLGLVAYYLGVTYYYCGQYNDSIDVLRIAIDLLGKDDVHQFMANCFLTFSYSEIEKHKKLSTYKKHPQ